MKKVVSVCLIDSDWKRGKKTNSTTKKLNSSISKWSSIPFPLARSLLKIERNACKISIYCFDWKSRKTKSKEMSNNVICVCGFFMVVVVVASARKLIEFHKVDEFWSICCGPSIRNQIAPAFQYWTSNQMHQKRLAWDLIDWNEKKEEVATRKRTVKNAFSSFANQWLREKSLVYIEMDFKLMLKYFVKLLEMFIEATSANWFPFLLNNRYKKHQIDHFKFLIASRAMPFFFVCWLTENDANERRRK